MAQRAFAIPKRILDAYRRDKSTVVSMVLNKGEMTYAATGTDTSQAGCAPEDLLFEIGSITKVFTALLLCSLVEDGKIDPDRPVKDIVAELSETPDWITPRSLATHTSGLPRIHVPLWRAAISGLPDDPYASFSRQDLIAWIKAYHGAKRPRRRRYAYSNLGFGLLGEVLAMSEGMPFTELLDQRIITPLGLTDTATHLSQAQQSRFMQPFDTKGKAVSPWTFLAIAGAGSLRASARDLGQFSMRIIQALSDPETALDRAICQSVSPQFGLGLRGAMEPVAQCFGWRLVRTAPDAPRMLFHNGGTAGSSSALYICPDAKAASVILANRGVNASLWSSLKLDWANPDKAMNDLFVQMRSHQT